MAEEGSARLRQVVPSLPWWMLDATHRLVGPDLFFYAL